MMEQTIEYKGYDIQIWHDDDPESPRSWDNLGTMALFHKRYDVANETSIGLDDFGGWDEMKAHIEKEYDTAVILPVYMYDHSGLSIRTTPFNDPWDSGQLGFIFVSKTDVENEYLDLSEANLQLAQQVLESEVKTYGEYINGEVYGYRINCPNKCTSCGHVHFEEEDSLWGIYGYDYAIEAAKEYVDATAKALQVDDSRTIS